MPNHEEEKKKWELEQCQLVAAEVNKQRGADYAAHPSEAEPADVVLKSQSQAHPTLPVQVVSIPLDFRHRDDKHSVEKIRDTLSQSLPARGLRHCSVGLILSGEAEVHGIKHNMLEVLTELILKEAATGNRTLRYDDIYERSPELSELVHDIIISHHEIIANVEIDIPAGSALPPDGRWIAEGIMKKMAKYGGAEAVKGLVLVIGVAGFVDDEQVEAFQKAHRPETLPFSQIWIVTPFHGVACLKGSEAMNAPTDREKYKYDACVKALQFELEQFWKRSLFFWGFIGTAFVAFAASESHRSLQIAFASLGFVCSVVWTLVNRGSKFWYEDWEDKLEEAEVPVTGRLYGSPGPERKVTDKWNSVEGLGKRLWKGKRYSPSKLAVGLSDYIATLWFCLLAYKLWLLLGSIYATGGWPLSKDVFVILFVGFSFVFAVLLGWFSRASHD